MCKLRQKTKQKQLQGLVLAHSDTMNSKGIHLHLKWKIPFEYSQ